MSLLVTTLPSPNGQGKNSPEKLKQEVGGLGGPTTLRVLPLLGLCLAPDTMRESSEGHDLELLLHIREELLRAFQRHVLDRARCLVRVLEMHAEIRTARFARLGRVVRIPRVVDASHRDLMRATDMRN